MKKIPISKTSKRRVFKLWHNLRNLKPWKKVELQKVKEGEEDGDEKDALIGV
jgi:hypothetical protein